MSNTLDATADTRTYYAMVDKLAGYFTALREGGTYPLFAVEAGSRLWGTESFNSDWDVRFVYARDPSSYVTVFEPERDTLEAMWPECNADVVGWDLKKALALGVKGNPPLWEWLTAPNENVYWDSPVREQMRTVLARCWRTQAALHHYYHMALGNWNKYLSGKTQVVAKKYLYVVRPLLASLWLMRHEDGEHPPVKVLELAYQTPLEDMEPGARFQFCHLLTRKRSGEELGISGRMTGLDYWINQAFERVRLALDTRESPSRTAAEWAWEHEQERQSANAFLRRVLSDTVRQGG